MADQTGAAHIRRFETSPPRYWLALTLVVLASVVLFLPSLRNYFMGEDFGHLYHMSQIRSWWDVLAVHEGFYRPVHVFFRFLEYTMSGVEPLGYHVASLVLHTVVTGLVFAADGMTLQWDVEPASSEYRLYQAAIPGLGYADSGTCLTFTASSAIPDPTTLPPLGTAWGIFVNRSLTARQHE